MLSNSATIPPKGLTRTGLKRTIVRMKYVIDANILLAVVLGEPEKGWLIDVTNGSELISPTSLFYEIGNALSAGVKRKALLPEQAILAWDTIADAPVELVEFDLRAALVLAGRFETYAYDAYYLQCALESGYPLLTLDRRMKLIAAELDVRVLEQP